MHEWIQPGGSFGTAFSFVSRLTINMLSTSVTLQKKLTHRYQPLDDTMVATKPDPNAYFDSAFAFGVFGEHAKQCWNKRLGRLVERNPIVPRILISINITIGFRSGGFFLDS